MSNRVMGRTVSASCVAVFLVTFCSTPGAIAETPADYLASERPDPQGTPTKVELTVLLLDLSEVDDLRQDFSVDVYLRARWRDARLAIDEPKSAAVRTLPLSTVWNPALGALNRRSLAILLPETVSVDSEGNVQYEQRIQGEFSARLDLREFPADEQALAIRFASYRHGPGDLEFEINRDITGRFEDLSVAGWAMGEPEVEAAPLLVPGGLPRAGVIYKLAAKRQTIYYVLTMVIPLLLIALMAWAVFWIDPSFLPSQIGVSTASVFSLIAFRLGLTSSLPRVAYLTRADEFVLAITVLVFVAFGEAILTSSLFKSGREELARKVDQVARWVYLGVLALVVFLVM